MARPLRIEYEGAFYHVINRGLERREIFRQPKDYEYFLGLLEYIYEKYGVIVYAFCLMPNHYHLYLQTPQGNLSKAMRQLDGNHTQKFNKRYKRVGPLFQGRYKAVLVDSDSYSLQLAKYIHLNPVKAKLIQKPEDYQHSSYSSYIGKTKAPIFLNTKWVLSQYAKSKGKAVKELKKHTLEAQEEDWEPEKDTFKSLILGGSGFVNQIQEEFLQGKENFEIPKLKAVQKVLSAHEIIAKIDRLKLGEKHKTKLIVYALKRYSPLTLKEIGEQFNNLHYSAVAQILIRLQKKLSTDKQLAKTVIEVDKLFNNKLKI
jgi:REP element-mobilizing transposase RayT